MKMLAWDGKGVTINVSVNWSTGVAVGYSADTPSTDAAWYIEISGAADPAALREQLKKFKDFELEGSTLRFPPRSRLSADGKPANDVDLFPEDALDLATQPSKYLGIEVGGLNRLEAAVAATKRTKTS